MTQLASPTPAASKLAAAGAAAQANADALLKDDALAQSKGSTPEHIDARKRVARLYCEIHMPAESAADRDARLATVDYTCPVTNINARGMDPNAPRKGGLFGFRRASTIWVSAQLPPENPEDPVYALEFFALKS
jgi:hypothetical protein